MRAGVAKCPATPGEKLQCFWQHPSAEKGEAPREPLGQVRGALRAGILLARNSLPFHAQPCVYMCAFIFLDTLVLVIYPFVLQIITRCGFNWMQIYSSLPVLNSPQLNSCCVLGVMNLHKICEGLA